MKTTIEKRILSAALAALTLALASCGQTGSGDGETTEPAGTTETTETEETVDTRYVPDLEVRDFGDKTLRILSYECPNIHYTMVPEEETGDTINDALFARNRDIEKNCGVKIAETIYTESELDTVRGSIFAGDDSYDLISVRCPFALPWYRENLIISYEDLPNINLSKGYWDKTLNESLTIDNVNYIAVGAYNLDVYDVTYCMLVNNSLCEQFGIDSIFSTIKDGKWTFDLMKQYMTTVASDLDGNSVMDEDDRYGYTAHPKNVSPDFWIGADELSIVKDENDHPIINMTDQHFVEVFDKIYNVVWDSNASYMTSGDDLDIPSECRKIFSENRSLFIDMSFFYIEAMRGVETDFGIIPYPKYDENQSEYHSRVCYYFPSVVPATCQDTDFVGYMLETLNYESYKTVIPAYYETALKTKYSRDAESSEMLDLIFASRRIDIGDSTLCDIVRDNFIYTMMKNDKRDIISTVARNEKTINKRLEQ